MIGEITASASTGLSPEWDRWFDEAFTDLITGDEDLLRNEFDDLIAASWQTPSRPGPSPAGSAGESPPESPRHEPPADDEHPGPDAERSSRPPP